MRSSTPPYLSYLLRLWLAGDDDHPQWRLALIDPKSGEHRGFASLQELVACLEGKMAKYTLPYAGDKTVPSSSQDGTHFRRGEDDGEITD
jgi:hypothetical protein